MVPIGEKIGSKVRDRINAVPENIRAAVDDARKESIATAAINAPKRFGEANRRLDVPVIKEVRSKPLPVRRVKL